MKTNFKRVIISLMAVVTISALFSACGNVQTSDKNVETSATTTTTTSASANAVTTVTTSGSTTSVGDVVTTAPTSTSESEPIVTTSATTSTATEEITTTTTKSTTTTIATKKPTTTTTKKATTTTAKKTTTTKKKTDKVTTTTAKKQVKLTQSDIDRLVKELQEYSNSKAVWVTENWQEFRGYGTEYTTLEEFFDYLCEDETPENNPNWTCPVHIFPEIDTYEEAYQYVKNAIDYDYKTFPDAYLFLYVRWCPNGEGSTNTCETRDCWDIYTLR